MTRILSGLLIGIMVILLSGCSNTKKTGQNATTPAYPPAILSTDWRSFGASAPVSISDASLLGDNLTLSIVYSGGCEKHQFQLIGSKLVSTSAPPKRSVKLHHNNQGDDCREMIEEVITFNIKSLAYNGEPTVIALEGYDTPIQYSPKK